MVSSIFLPCQICIYVTSFFSDNSKAAENKLNVKTYKIIPFSRRSGMLQWCANTSPLGRILSILHKAVRPYGLAPGDARKRLHDACNATNVDAKLIEFKQICKEIKPVFHHFWYWQYKVPGLWFERKMSYVNSVATKFDNWLCFGNR